MVQGFTFTEIGGKMKFMVKFLIALFLIGGLLCGPAVIWANPFLVCDAYPTDAEIQGFRGTVNGVVFDTPYSLHASGAAIIYDCVGLGSEKWNFVNIRAYNVRGESVNVPFVYPALPGDPAMMRIVQ